MSCWRTSGFDMNRSWAFLILLYLVGIALSVSAIVEKLVVHAQAPTQVDLSRQVRTANLAVTRMDDHTLTIGKNCSVSTPCNVRFGSQVFSFVSPVGISATSGTGVLNVWVNPSGQLVIGALTTGVSCSGPSPGCFVVSASGFPSDGSIPISTWQYLNGTLAPTQSNWLTDTSATPIKQGFGITLVQHGQYTEIAVDATQVLSRVPVPASSSETCPVGSFAMDRNFFYLCVGLNSWARAPIAAW